MSTHPLDPTYARAMLNRCPVSWCKAPPGEACWDQFADIEVDPHAPRRSLVPTEAFNASRSA